jgi:hypothetical protein
MNSKMNRLLTFLVLGLGLTLGLLKVLSTPFTRPPVARAADRHVCLSSCPYDSIQAAVDDTNDGNVKAATGTYTNNQIAVNSITIDSNREGWESVVPYTSDDSGDGGGAGNVDWITVTMAHDCDDLYVRYEVNDGPSILTEPARYNLLLDIDRSRNTGFHGWGNSFSIGADVLVQGATVFTFAGANQEHWAWDPIQGYDVDDQPLSGSKRDIEYKVSISDLDVSGDGVTGFDWLVWADHTWGDSPIDINNCDFYPDDGNGGETGDFNTYTLDYTRSTSLFSNPERGFFHQTNTHEPYGDKTLAAYQLLATHPGTSTLRCYREHEGITLIHRNFWLSEFVTSTISDTYLTAMQDDFDAVREAGLKMIVRFAYTPAYTNSITCAGESDLYDASKDWILTHTQQLSDVLRANSDVIAAVQAGFIGGWGEWWGSCHFPDLECCCSPDDPAWDDRRDVLFAILDTLPATRMVQLRTPRYKYNIFSDTVICSDCIPQVLTPTNESQAHTGIPVARTGHHNDCFASSASDYGTYVYTPTEYAYLEEDTKWVVMGGETCDPGFAIDPDPDRLKCSTALTELEQFHWSYLNIDWYEPTLRKWRDEGCFPEIEQRLGYSFTLTTPGTFSDQIRPGGDFTFSLQLENKGFAAPFNPRTVELILRHTNGSTYPFKLPDDRQYDPCFWLPGEIHTISHTIHISPSLPATGCYELLLNLPDPELPDPKYAIRLANENTTWEENTGYNNLNHVVGMCIYLPTILKSY